MLTCPSIGFLACFPPARLANWTSTTWCPYIPAALAASVSTPFCATHRVGHPGIAVPLHSVIKVEIGTMGRGQWVGEPSDLLD